MNDPISTSSSASDLIEEVCTEAEFIPILVDELQPLFRITEDLRATSRGEFLNRRVLGLLLEEACDLEDLLDQFDARYNSTFAGLGEIVASLRIFSAISLTLRQLQSRVASNNEFLGAELDKNFRSATRTASAYAEETVRALFRALRNEVTQICGREIVADLDGPLEECSVEHRLRLPRDISAEEGQDLDHQIAIAATLFLSAHRTLVDASAGRRFEDIEEMQTFVRETCDEDQCRFFEAKLRNLKSRYDTFIKNTPQERSNPLLPKLERHITIAGFLLQMMTELVHFYERHEDDMRGEAAKERVIRIVDKRRVLDQLLNYGLYFVHQIMSRGVSTAEELLRSHTTIETLSVQLPEGAMLHARPAALISKIVARHETPVELEINGDSCFAGSIMQVILLAGKHLGTRSLVFRGDQEPLRDLRLLFECGLGEGEEGLASLPSQLSYLQS